MSRAPQVQPRAGRALPITARDREVWALMALGLTNKEIARRLNMGLGTVKIHSARAIRRNGCRNRVEAALAWHGVRLAA